MCYVRSQQKTPDQVLAALLRSLDVLCFGRSAAKALQNQIAFCLRAVMS